MRRFPFLIALLLVLLTAPAAEAAFPGANGRIAFTRDAGANEEIYTAQPDGTDARAITTNAWGDRMPAFSPDGSRIAFVSLENGTSEIYVMDADGTAHAAHRLRRQRLRPGVVAGRGADRLHEQPFAATPTSGSWTSTARTAPLATHAADDTDPAWSPDGSTIAFETARDGGASRSGR